MTRNVNKVPKKQWDKWNCFSRESFNRIYNEFSSDQGLINAHPKAKKLSPDQWKTVSWNAAWRAADLESAIYIG